MKTRKSKLKPNSKGRIPVTLSLKVDLLNKYNEYCKINGMILSRRIELLIKEDLRRATR